MESPAADPVIMDAESSIRDAFYLTQEELAQLLGQVYSDDADTAEA